MQVLPIKTRIFRENENLTEFILKYLEKIPKKNLEGSVLVVTSKIVALSEGRVVPILNKRQKIKLIKQESDFAIETKIVWLTIKDGMVMANAGIDESNANGKIILLPEDSFKAAEMIRKNLIKKYKIKNLGVLVTDSRTLPFRAGIVGAALGYAGFEGIKNYVGKKDIFGRKFRMSKVDVADSLATAAVVCMGEGAERQPLAVIKNAPVIFTKKINKKELIINRKVDIYAPLFNKLS